MRKIIDLQESLNGGKTGCTTVPALRYASVTVSKEEPSEAAK